MEGQPGQARPELREGEELSRPPINPSIWQGGLAPCLKLSTEEVDSFEREENACEESRVGIERSACRLNEFVSGHDIFEQVGTRIIGIEITGCMLAWIVAKAGGFRRDPAWNWAQRILFEERVTATCRERPKGAVSFPVRLGDLEPLVATLGTCSLAEVTQSEFVQANAEDCWLMASLFALNSLAGFNKPLAPGKWSKLEKRGIDNVRAAVKRLLDLPRDPLESFEKVCEDFRHARVGYDGEEVGSCELLSLSQILPALPPLGHGGSISLSAVLSQATYQQLLHPEDLLKEDFTKPIPSIPGKAHFAKGERTLVCSELVRRGICTWVKAEEVLVFKGKRILNGLFGVRKPAQLEDGRPILRVIMNLKASNSVLKQLKGSVHALPAITCFQSTVLDKSEEMSMYQSDMCSAFYMFRLPVAWHPFLCFNVCAKGFEIGKTDGQEYYLSCSVLPMGWHCSVGLMQEISERVLWNAGLPASQQIRRGVAIPPVLTQCAHEALSSERGFWQVYLDNFMAGDKRALHVNPSVGDHMHDTAEAAWARTGIISSDKKRVAKAEVIEELGAMLGGRSGFLGGSPKRFCKLAQATCWVLSQKALGRKQAQILAGRWVHVLQFRRPGMGWLDHVWKFINGKKGESNVSLKTKREFFLIMSAIPLLHTSMTATVTDSFWCSDASERGGAFTCARELSPVGKDFLMASRLASRTLGSAPILVIALFSGIGGTFRVYDILDIIPQGAIAVDVHKPANRIVSRRWPGVHILRDVRDIGQEQVEEWALDFAAVQEVHLWGGFPCRDLSSARANRKNLEGRDSSLFFEFLRIWELLVQQFPHSVKIKVAAENVASMDEQASTEISEWMGVQPYYLDCIDAVPMRRPRLCWTTEQVEGSLDGVQCFPERRWTKIVAKAPHPTLEQWLAPECTWPGEGRCEGFPTCMRAVPKKFPPSFPAGLERADSDCRDRWEASEFIYPPYQFRAEFLIWKDSRWRLINSEERGLLMGYGHEHCSLAWPASRIKEDKGYELEKCSLIGDAFSIHSFVVIGCALCRGFLPQIHYHHLAARMGLSPGFRAPLRFQAPIRRSLQYGCQNIAEAQEGLTVSELNKLFLGRANFTGSDVRITSGDLLNPKAFPRQPVCAGWWKWQHCFTVKWKEKHHINLLELRAIILSVQRGLERENWNNCRIFHATDSYVCMSVISKGRTSSLMLNKLLKKLNALLLFHGLQMLVVHVESSENPTDAASRQ